jgi:hypothetical protein
MNLKELSIQYNSSARLCKGRIHELKLLLELEGGSMCETDIIDIQRRISILTSMMRDTFIIARYLKDYYGDDENG